MRFRTDEHKFTCNIFVIFCDDQKLFRIVVETIAQGKETILHQYIERDNKFQRL